ncbi:MAG: biotin/lipoyl-binding protein [Candidatus Gracilibacteria bacterium]|nr:biotin/lipoyl-binding protein [Candidatus Gracilibacteria bacterium]
MKKILSLIVLLFIFLSSCSKEDNILDNLKKQDYIIKTKNINDFTGSLLLEKTGKLGSSQDIKVSSQVSGRIKKIYVKEGSQVKINDTIAIIDDNISNYNLVLEKSKNSLDKAKNSYESTKISLDKQIFDSQIAVEKLDLKIESFKKDYSENLKKAQNELQNTNIINSDTKSSLEIEKIDNSINKQELDLDNKKIADNETINGFNLSIKKDYSTLNLYLNDVIEFSDKILGVTIANRDKNDLFENYLGAKNITKKLESETNFNSLLNYKINQLDKINFDNLDENSIKNNVLIILDGYNKINLLLSSLEETVNNSIISVGNLSQSDINNYINSINIYQSNYTGNSSSIISFKNNINSFFKNYKLNYESITKQIDLLKKDKEILLKSIESNELNSQVGYNKILLNYDETLNGLNIDLKTAINNLDNAEKNKEISLKNLENSIRDAELSYIQAYDSIEKLVIKSPINGTISKIHIDEGQEVSIGRELFSLLNNNRNEVIIGFSKDELNYIKNGSIAYIDYENKTYTGTIYSISNMADTNLKYISVISFPEGVNFVGDIVNIKIPFTIGSKLLPINIIKVDNNKNGLINIYDDGKIIKKNIRIGKIYGNNVEILDLIEPNTNIIINNVDNFDDTKYDLKVDN